MEPVFKTEGTELRSFDFELRADRDDRGDVIEGVPIVFGRATDLGLFDEVIDRGALDGADMRDVRFLVNHNTDMTPLARSRNNNGSSTMRMEVRDDGLHVTVRLDTENNADARSLYSAVSRGDVSGMSFMFTVDGARWDGLESDHPVRTITAIGRVFEVSAVTFPAYEDTTISARCRGTLESARSTLESARAERGISEEERACAVAMARSRNIGLSEL